MAVRNVTPNVVKSGIQNAVGHGALVNRGTINASNTPTYSFNQSIAPPITPQNSISGWENARTNFNTNQLEENAHKEQKKLMAEMVKRLSQEKIELTETNATLKQELSDLLKQKNLSEEQYSRDLDAVNKTLKEERDLVQQLNNSQSKAKHRVNELEAEMEQKVRDNAELKEKKRDVEQQLQSTKESMTTNKDSLIRELSDAKNKLSAGQAKMNSLEADHSRQVQAMTNVKNQLETTEASNKELEKIRQDLTTSLSELTTERTQIRNDVTTQLSHIQRIKDELLSSNMKIIELETKVAEGDVAAKEEISKLKKSLDKQVSNQEKVREATQELVKNRKLLDRAQAENERHLEREKLLQQQIKEAGHKLEQKRVDVESSTVKQTMMEEKVAELIKENELLNAKNERLAKEKGEVELSSKAKEKNIVEKYEKKIESHKSSINKNAEVIKELTKELSASEQSVVDAQSMHQRKVDEMLTVKQELSKTPSLPTAREHQLRLLHGETPGVIATTLQPLHELKTKLKSILGYHVRAPLTNQELIQEIAMEEYTKHNNVSLTDILPVNWSGKFPLHAGLYWQKKIASTSTLSELKIERSLEALLKLAHNTSDPESLKQIGKFMEFWLEEGANMNYEPPSHLSTKSLMSKLDTIADSSLDFEQAVRKEMSKYFSPSQLEDPSFERYQRDTEKTIRDRLTIVYREKALLRNLSTKATSGSVDRSTMQKRAFEEYRRILDKLAQTEEIYEGAKEKLVNIRDAVRMSNVNVATVAEKNRLLSIKLLQSVNSAEKIGAQHRQHLSESKDMMKQELLDLSSHTLEVMSEKHKLIEATKRTISNNQKLISKLAEETKKEKVLQGRIEKTIDSGKAEVKSLTSNLVDVNDRRSMFQKGVLLPAKINVSEVQNTLKMKVALAENMAKLGQKRKTYNNITEATLRESGYSKAKIAEVTNVGNALMTLIRTQNGSEEDNDKMIDLYDKFIKLLLALLVIFSSVGSSDDQFAYISNIPENVRLLQIDVIKGLSLREGTSPTGLEDLNDRSLFDKYKSLVVKHFSSLNVQVFNLVNLMASELRDRLWTLLLKIQKTIVGS